MKLSAILGAAALCVFPVVAQSQNASLIYTQLTSRNFTLEGEGVFSADKSSSYALRYGHDITKFSPLGDARLAFEGTWLPRTSGETVKVDGIPAGSATTSVKYRHEYLGLGLSLNWTKVVDFGGALELRHEGNVLSVKGTGMEAEFGSDFTRPWLSLHVGYTFVIGSVNPFVSLEYSLPLAKKEVDINVGMGPYAEFMIGRDLNPKSQISLNAGIRF